MDNVMETDAMRDLQSLLFSGIKEVLEEATAEGVLQAPYGRPKQVTLEEIEEKLNEESDSDDDDAEGDEGDEEDSSDEEIEFEYSYGYNPLVRLGMYLRRNNPKNIALREEQRAARVAFVPSTSSAAAAINLGAINPPIRTRADGSKDFTSLRTEPKP